MGVIIKYQLEFPEVRLKISNDILSGEFIIDANIATEMKRNTGGASFKIELIDLPKRKADEIKAQLPSLAKVIIKLGYFDSPFEKVMEGIIEDIKSVVQEDRLVTTIKGLETGTYALKNNLIDNTLDDNITITAAVSQILQDDEIRRGSIEQSPQLQNISGTLRRRSYRRKKVMRILDELAEAAHAEFMVSDKKVWMGKPIRDDQSYQPPKFDRDVNLAVFSPIDNEVTEEASPNVLLPLPATRADGFRFTVLGDPKLRPGQRVKATVDDFETQEFRIHSLTHKFTMTGGYVCEGSAMKVSADENCRRRELSLGIPGPAAVAESIKRASENGQDSRPTLEIGKVKTYTPGESTGDEKHLGTLYFGQTYGQSETQPSINIAIENNEQRLFRNKPLVSPFAWHKCGLVVPVYQGMKAMLNHNLSLQDDVLISGFIWSDTPVIEPPKNKAGDWWLCLPIDFDSANPPSDSTKAVNDLTANNGKRILQLKGLKITIGNSTLQNVGERPTEGEDDEFLIEHSSGTILRIAADGKMTIEAENLAIKGDVTIEGNLSMKGDATIEGNVEVK
jgi:hypothetical protein